jgi:tRNA (mo5U34)-methyltransferase
MGASTANAGLPDLSARLAPFFRNLAPTRAGPWAEALERLTTARLRPQHHGDLPGWLEVLSTLPDLPPGKVVLDAPCVGVVADTPLSDNARDDLACRLDAFHPWRKGPFCLHGVHIDSEWRSDLKWNRLAGEIAPLDGRIVLDCGCGNGWYGYRCLGAGAALVLGIDPTLRFVLQFLAVNHFIGSDGLAVLPLTDEDLVREPLAGLTGFDTVFSMGVIYHRRDPDRHLAVLRSLMRPGAELVLETLVLDRPGRDVLRPEGRYAKMRNVHAIPTPALVQDWLTAAGFGEPRIIDVSPTTPAEQRATPWMHFQSLTDFLDPVDPHLTVEGHPAPVRGLFLARRWHGPVEQATVEPPRSRERRGRPQGKR